MRRRPLIDAMFSRCRAFTSLPARGGGTMSVSLPADRAAVRAVYEPSRSVDRLADDHGCPLHPRRTRPEPSDGVGDLGTVDAHDREVPDHGPANAEVPTTRPDQTLRIAD